MSAIVKHDINRLLRTIRHEEPDRVPWAEMMVDGPVKSAFMGRPINTVEGEVAFQDAAGFDYVYLRAEYDYPGTSPVVSTGTPRAWLNSDNPENESVSTTKDGPLASFADMDKIEWPDPATVPVNCLKRAAEILPEGMGIITGVGGCFTRTWMLMGYERFCLYQIDQPELVKAVADRVGAIQCAVLRRLVKMPGVRAVWYGDDLAYTEGLLASPRLLRTVFFPWIEELAHIAHQAGMPFIMHSDGRLWDVLDDLIALGLNALHPIEPKAMDIFDLKRRYGQKLAMFGNIDVGYTLQEGTGDPATIREEVRQKIKALAPGGGYAVATGSGFARYIAVESFHALRDAWLEFGQYPINL